MTIRVNSVIMDLAEEVASRYDEPVPLLKVAEDEFIKIIFDDYGSSTFDGLTWFEEGTDDFYIHLNIQTGNNNRTTKGRFTLAHELGHYFIPTHRKGLINGTLKPHGSVSYLTNQRAWQIEREADAFASSLLMPKLSFGKFIQGKQFCFGLIEKIAERYNVSISAAALRFADIGNDPLLICYAVDGKIRWVSHSDDFPFWRMRYGSGKGERVPENTVMGTFFYDHDNSDCRKQEIVFAKDCFETRCKEDNNREFYEWCIEHKNRALSLFWEKRDVW